MTRHTIGTVPSWTGTGNPTRATLTVEAHIDGNGELHMTGETKRPRARDIDSFGQMQDTIREWIAAEDIDYAPGWDDDRARRMLEVWDRWHLNHMRAGCEHQRAEWNPAELLTIYTWTIDPATTRQQSEAKRDAWTRLEAGETVALDEETRALLALPYTITTPTEQPPPHYTTPRDGSPWQAKETKAAGWVRPDEHPGGLLGKPCETCGYKYGTEWRTEELPADVADLVAGGFRDEPHDA